MAYYRGYRGRVGARAAYALLLHRADKRGLSIAAGRLGEALLLFELFAHSLLALGEVRDALRGALALLVLLLLIHGGIAREEQLGIARAEAVPGAAGLDRDVVVHGVGHLAGGKAAPDEAVEHILLARQIAAHQLGREVDVRRAYGLVGVLRPGAGLEAARLCRAVGLAVVGLYEAARGGDRLLAQPQGVGSHIGYEAYRALARDVHALVELLGDAHRAPGRHAQAAGGLLLESGGDEGRRGASLLLAALDGVYGKGAAPAVGYDGVGLGLVLELGLLFALAVIARGEAAAVGAAEHGVEQPVLLGHKGANLVLAVDHHARGHALHAARGEAAAYLLPQQRRELIADDAVEYAPRLLRVDEVYVNLARLVYALRDDLLRNLVEGDAAGPLVGQLQKLLEVPGDGLALAVRVGREVDHVRLGGALAQLLDDVLLALDGDIVRREAVLQVHAHCALGQVAQMAHAGHDLEIPAQVLLYGSCLRRRLDNDERRLSFRH